MVAPTVVGTSIPRVDGVEKVTGGRRFAADVSLPGTLWGKVLRSPHPHARIARIETSAARAVPGVHAVLTAADLPTGYIGRHVQDLMLLARDRVRFVGDKVAVVAADSPDTAEEVLGLIQVEYEALPAVFDPFDAMQPDAPILHPNFPAYRNAGQVPDIANVHSYVTWGHGDIERGFAEAELVFEDRFSVPMQHQGYIEPHACLVHADDQGQVWVWNSSKQPFLTRSWLAQAVGLPEEQVKVLPVSIGGDFGGKGYLADEPLAYFLSKATGRPIRMVMSYVEELLAGVPRHAAVISIRSGLKRDGTLVARHAKLVFNSGAYSGNKPLHHNNLSGAESACGVYRIPHTLIESYCVYTNQVPCGHMRAPGWMQATFAAECHTDMLAERLEMDPLEFRRRNVLKIGEEAPTGEHWRNLRAAEVLDRAAELARWGTRRAEPNVGLGLSLSYEHIGTGKSGAIMSVDEGGQVKLVTGVPDVGTGAHTIFRQIAAETLGIAADDVMVEIGDTDSAPFDSGSGADRVTHVAGTAVQRTAVKLRDELCALAAELMGWPEGRVQLVQGHFQAEGAEGRTAFRELAARAARASGGRVEVRESIQITHHVDDRNVTAQVAEVVVDPESGQVTLRRLISVQDIGRVLNPRLAEGQVEGGAISGLGYALMEDLRVEDGKVVTLNFADYKLPCVQDVPTLEQAFLASEEGPAPFGSKAVGEVSICGVAPAVANAVARAAGVRVTDLPITAERVFNALRRRGQK